MLAGIRHQAEMTTKLRSPHAGMNAIWRLPAHGRPTAGRHGDRLRKFKATLIGKVSEATTHRCRGSAPALETAVAIADLLGDIISAGRSAP